MSSSISSSTFYILLTVRDEARHGYEIMKQVKIDSQGVIKLGPGTLYTAIKRLLEQGLIRERQKERHPRRRYYALTAAGHRVVNQELERYATALTAAKIRPPVGHARGAEVRYV